MKSPFLHTHCSDRTGRVIPVLDLQNGQVVRGVGGRRHDYQPLRSQLTASSEPVEVAQAFRSHFGLTEIYLADLNAIAGSPPAWPAYTALHDLGFQLWVDAGVRDAAAIAPLAYAGIKAIVLGLETIAGPHVLSEACAALGSARVVFSLDLKGGVPLGDLSAWNNTDALAIAAQAIERGVRRLLLLDLARVGSNQGIGTERLCAELVTNYPEVEIATGGGVRDANDLKQLREIGVHAVLVASALHAGRIRRNELRALTPERWPGWTSPLSSGG